MIRQIDIGRRKHVSQMTAREQSVIWKRLKDVQEYEWELIPHALDRLEEKGIRASKQDVISTIYNSSIIEYRIVHNSKVENGIDERVILRSKSVVNDRYNLNVVFSLTTKRIITVWKNHVKDRHKTLDWSIYSSDMEVLGA